MRTILIAGSRGIKEAEYQIGVWLWLLRGSTDVLVISGGAKGVDVSARDVCSRLNIPFQEFPADWDKHGKAAGYIRNEVMVKKCSEAFIIWDGESRGTKHTIDLLLKYKKPFRISFDVI